MVNSEILGGLRAALNRGESLEKIMVSFYNAGYRKEEIEEAARIFQQEESPAPIAQETKLIPSLQNSQSKISLYGKKNKSSLKKIARGLIIVIIAAAIIFVGLLIAFLVTT